MSNLADLLVHIGIDADDLKSGFDSAVSSVEDNIGKITAASVIAGGAMEGFARGQAPLREAAAKIAAATGEEADEINRLAREASNVTFPLAEVYASMESGRQQGLKSGEQLQQFATFWDMVGDASGESGPALAESAVALRAVGIEAGNESEALSALGFITRETTSSNKDFLTFLERTGPELRGMGADVDDAAAILGVLESELGMSGRTARTEFRSAINESDGTLEGMLDTLGVSADQFDEYSRKVADSSGVIEENAAIHAESYTAMQRAQHWASELMSEYSGLFGMASSLALPLMALGPLLKGVTAAMNSQRIATIAGTVASKAAAVAQWALNVAMSANPIMLIVLAIAALVAAFIWAWNNVDGFAEFFIGIWEWIKTAWSAVGQWFSDLWADVLAFFTSFGESISSTAESIWNGILDFFRAIPGKIVDFFLNWTLLGLLISHWDSIKDGAARGWNAVVDWVKAIPGKIVDFFMNWTLIGLLIQHWDSIKEGAVTGWNAVVDWIRDIPSKITTALGNLGRLLWNAGSQIIGGLLSGITDKFEDVKDFVGGIGDWIADHKGPKAYDLALLQPAGGWIMDGLRAGIEDEIPALESTLGKVSGAISVDAATPGVSAAVRSVAASAPGGVGSGPLDLSDRTIARIAEALRSAAREAVSEAGRDVRSAALAWQGVSR